MTNNLGRTEVSTSQTQKETAINNSDGVIDAAITDTLTINWSGADALKTLTSAQLQNHVTFKMSGSTTEPAPVLKMASVQRGMVLVDNDLAAPLTVTDYTSAVEITVDPGVLAAVYVTATGVERVFKADSIVLPADTSYTVRVATTANITISTALNSGDVIDGITLADGDLVLVKNQTTKAENGVYVVDAVPYRATDFDDGGTEVFAGILLTVTEGTANGDSLWILTTNNPITVGTTALVFSKLAQNSANYASDAQIVAGAVNTAVISPKKLADIWKKGSNVASASTLSLGYGRYFHVTGTTTITDIDFANTSLDGREAVLVFDGSLTLTHNATTLVLPGGADINTAAGDRAAFIQDASDNVYCIWYQRADGTALVNSSGLSPATTSEVLGGTEASNYVTPEVLYALWGKGTNVASAATTALGDGGYFHITGTTTISDLDWSDAQDGRPAIVVFDGILTLTHNATTLKLPTGANITTAAGDTACFVQDASDNVKCVWYQRADGTPLALGSLAVASPTDILTGTDNTKIATADAIAALWEKGSNVASAATVSFGEGGYFHITGTTTITDIDWATAKNGRWAVVVFDGILTLTHNATTLLLPGGANITTAANDRAMFIQDASDNVYCVWYQRADGTALASSGSFTAASTTEVLTGTDTSKGATPDAIAALWEQGSDIASAGTISIGEGGMFHVTGTTTITDIDWATDKAGRGSWIVFTGALTLTYNVTTLILPTAANIVTAAGDCAYFVSEGTDVARCLMYLRADGKALTASSSAASTTEVLTGTDTAKFATPDAIASLWEQGSNIASAGTISIGEGGFFHVTGTTTITDIDWATDKAGRGSWICFDGALTLTYNATTLILPTSANITTAAGDIAYFVSEGSDVARCLMYYRKDGTALTASGFTAASTTEVLTGTDTTKGATPDAIAALWEKGSNVASAATVSLGEGGYFHITGTTTITDIDFATAKDGRWAWVVFDGALTLTHNATTLLLPGGANITTAANDTALFIQDASDNVYCAAYIKASGKSVKPSTQTIAIACSDETTALTTGTAKATFRMPYAFTLTSIKGSLTTAQASGSTLTVDVNQNGTTIMSTNKITFDNTEKTTATAATAPGLTTTALSDDEEITVDIDTVGTSGATGLKVYLIGYPTNG